MREFAEMTYQFDRPFVMDSSASEQLLGLAPTALAVALADTLQWWGEELALPASRASA
jgi:hypothetical protein